MHRHKKHVSLHPPSNAFWHNTEWSKRSHQYVWMFVLHCDPKTTASPVETSLFSQVLLARRYQTDRLLGDAARREVRSLGIEAAVKQVPLLGDSSGDTGWRAWHRAVGLPYLPSKSSLTIPDSNSRVQAVIDGQGIALWDDLVAPEIKSGQLVELTYRKLDTSGYYLVFTKNPHATQVQAMIDWLCAQKAIL